MIFVGDRGMIGASGRRPTSGVVIERKRTLTVATVNGVGRPTAGVGVAAAVAARGSFGRLRNLGASTVISTSDCLGRRPKNNRKVLRPRTTDYF